MGVNRLLIFVAVDVLPGRRHAQAVMQDAVDQLAKSLLETLPTVGGTDLDLRGQDAACR